MIRPITLAGLIGLASQAAFCQSHPAPPAFEAVSIKPSQSGGPRSGVRAQAGNLTGNNVTLKQLMTYANDIPGYLLLGPDWIETDGYDVAATAKNSPSVTELRLMLRTLLEDRFKLKTHRETKEIPAYWLVIAEGGPKLRDPKEEESFNSALAGRSPFRPGFAGVYSNKSLPEFAERLGRPMDRPLLDKTGIQGRYWFQLEWADEPDQAGRQYLLVGAKLLTALREQVGLTLEEGNARVEILMIDSAEKPLGN